MKLNELDAGGANHSGAQGTTATWQTRETNQPWRIHGVGSPTYTTAEIHPDKIFDEGTPTGTFVYTQNHKLHLMPSAYATHGRMLKDYDNTYNVELIRDLGWTETDVALHDKATVGGRDAMTMTALLGRVGKYEDNHIVAFWPSPTTDDLLTPCLAELIKRDIIDEQTPVYSSHTDGEPALTVINGAAQHDPERERKLHLARQVHLLRGDEKKAAMKELGVGGGSEPHPVAAALEKHKLLKPGQKWWAPHSEAKDPDLQRTGPEITDYYINPDSVMDCVPEEFRTTFVFVPPDKLFYHTGWGTHGELIRNEPRLRLALHMTTDVAGAIVYLPESILAFGLFGRSGIADDVGQQLVSFWNSPQEVFDELIGPCLDALIEHRIITQDAYVHYPTKFNIQVKRLFAGGSTGGVEDAPEAMRRAELARQMHLARGAEKKAIMRELGVGGGGSSSPHPVAAALEKHKLLKPGQKWWAPHSEGVDRT